MTLELLCARALLRMNSRRKSEHFQGRSESDFLRNATFLFVYDILSDLSDHRSSHANVGRSQGRSRHWKMVAFMIAVQ